MKKKDEKDEESLLSSEFMIKLPKSMPLHEQDRILIPPKPLFGPFQDDKNYDWPLKNITKGFFDQADIPIKSEQEIIKERKLKEANAARLLESDDEHDNNEINEPDEDEINHDIADDLINSNKITNDKLDKQDKKQKIVETTNWDNNDDMEFELSE